MAKTMSIRMDRENYEFLSEMTKEEKSDLSKAVCELVTRADFCLPSRSTGVEKLRWVEPQN
jgi:hypothetical protein